MKKTIGFIAFLGMCLLLNSPVFAHEVEDGGQCKMGSNFAKGHGRGMSSQNQCPIAGKLMKQAHLYLENKKELGLTDDQVKTIKDIKLQSEKDSARQGADMKIFMLDLKSKLHEDKVDVEGTDAIIDKNFSAFATAAKSNVDAYAKLKAVLTPEQNTKLKDIWEKEEAHEHEGSWKRGEESGKEKE